jgi:plastocyanin
MKRLLTLGCAAAIAGTALAANLAGKVSFLSKRGQNPNAAETLVWLEPVSAHPARRPAATFQMLTRNKTLVPHVLAIPVGSTVDFPNDDPISHNLFSLSPANGFDLGLYRRGAGKSHKFDSPGIVNVYCNVHPNMSAVIHVMATPYYTFADASGNYGFSEIPAGKYKLVAWNEQGGTAETPIEVSTSGLVTGNLAVTLDSRNYRVAQHTNKEGKSYAPIPRDY